MTFRLSCLCDYDGDGWWYYKPDDYQMLTTGRRCRCCSCHALIDIGAQCVRFSRARHARSEIEENIHGDVIELAYWYMCEPCGDIYYSLSELGFCITLGDSMPELLEEYVETYNPPRMALKSN